jgi:UDP:flavonoid glycosyltransferase YjiC (YdhE family)
MTILIVAGGTRGDVQPMLALALELRRRGHEVRFSAAPNFEGWIREHQLPFRAVGRDIQAFLAGTGLEISAALGTLKEDLRREYAVLAEETAGADVILGASVTCAGVSFAEKLRVPYLYFVFSPSLIPSAHHPSPTCPWLHLPRLANRLSWWGVRLLWNRIFRGVLVEERARMGLGPVRDTWSHIQDAPLVVACDPALARPAPDAPARVWQPGPMLLAETSPLPNELERFLAAGPPPVYIGFGSMPDRNPARTGALVREALERAGTRAVLARGWAGLNVGDGSPDLFVADALPHRALFPRMAAVVHHGGSGTTVAAARAGVPQLVVPHLLDQFFWAERVRTLELGPGFVSRRRLTARRLASGLRACLDQPRFGDRARALVPHLVDDGVASTADLVEAAARRPASATRERAAGQPARRYLEP